MSPIDITVIVLYFIFILWIGYRSSKKITNSEELFTAGSKSPWWVAGISSYMTMFSAGTFVIWGGVAYRMGAVTITFMTTFFFGAVLAGYLFAGRWKEQGVTSAAEFINKKYGYGVLQMYTLLGIITRMVGVAVSIYAIAVVVSTLIPVAPDSIFGTENGTLDVNVMIVLLGIIVIVYTFMGGLWAVLMTDVIQFVILLSSVIILVPGIINLAGGTTMVLSTLPEGHLDLFSHPYTIAFMALCILNNAFKIGGEWAFVQRHLCVKTPEDAKKASYLFGILYLVTPFFWMIPPIVFRTIVPDANPEQAYIMAAQMVLPVGLLGLMIAAMVSATASMADSELNVFSAALTKEFYAKKINPSATDSRLLVVGRMFTILLGSCIVILSISIPYLGGAERLIISVGSLFVGPMVMPVLWALIGKRVHRLHAYLTVGVTAMVSFILKFMINDIAWVAHNMTVLELIVGISTPIMMLILADRLTQSKQELSTAS